MRIRAATIVDQPYSASLCANGLGSRRSAIFAFVACALWLALIPFPSWAQEGLVADEPPAAEDEVKPPPARAISELKLVEAPLILTAPSPFYHQIPGGVELALRRATAIRWSRRGNALLPKDTDSLSGRSPLVGGGVSAYDPGANGSPTEESLASALNEDEALSRQRAIDSYTATIASLETDGGAWNSELVENLHVLGTLLQEQGKHDEALEVFDRAVHIDRINSGLHSESQIASVENKLQSLLALNRWDEADLTFEYLYYVQRRAYGRDDPRLIPILDSIAEWNLRAFFIGHGEALGLRLSNALMFYNAAASMVKYHFGSQDERFVAYLRGIANSSYLVSRNPELMSAIERPEYRNAQSMMQQQLMPESRAVSQGFSSGAQALTLILRHELEARDDALAIAEAFSNLGDWYLLFGRSREAEKEYRSAWDLLANQARAVELLNAHFGRIVPMPTFVGEESKSVEIATMKEGNTPLRSDYADVMFDVTKDGVVRNVRMVSAETEENSIQLGRLRRIVRDSHFRPVIRDGVPQSSRDNVVRYRYWY